MRMEKETKKPTESEPLGVAFWGLRARTSMATEKESDREIFKPETTSKE
jgi:hypothetical protein